MRFIFFLFLTHVAFVSVAQIDTVHVLQYNLLNYGNSANPTSFKDHRLATILQYTQPDVVGVNEVFNDSTLLDHFRDSVLGSGWERSPFYNTASQTQFSAIFWRSSILTLRNSELVTNITRDIAAYTFRYNDTVTSPHDTVFVTFIVAHLKAGTSNADAGIRATETSAVVDWINSKAPGNYVFMGDLNTYKSSEVGYQNLVGSGVLVDPINRPGNWSDNPAFADVHTQSPRDSSVGDGGFAGGLDDRFDQILVSPWILGDSAGMVYIEGTYEAIGQDGLHFNTSLISSPMNTSAPPDVIQALYEMSDHLPVRASFVFHAKPTEPASVTTVKGNPIKIVNPAHGSLEILGLNDARNYELAVYDLTGRLVWQNQITGAQSIQLPLQGMYIIELLGRETLPHRQTVLFQ